LPGEKTESATHKKRKEQRKEGNTVLSQDIVSATVLLCIFGVLKVMGFQFTNEIANGMQFFLGGIGQNLAGGGDIRQQFIFVVTIAAEVLTPILIINIIVSVVGTMAQTRLLISPKAVSFKFSKINPITGFKNLFSPRSLMEVFKSILKIIIIGYIMYAEIDSQLPQLLQIYGTSVNISVSWTADLILNICFKASVAFLIIGIADYFFQWWDYERRLRMSKQEIKEEFKQTEGNPATKNRIRGEQRRLARSRQIQAVPAADVVIRNPTHYAIALKYDKDKTRAPVVVAKGQNNVALKIVEVAEASRVHIIENRPLAQALFKTVNVGDEIPEEFYKAVAEVLAYIYRLKRAGRT
jgi:flagellar biosynthetic protein FlhB